MGGRRNVVLLVLAAVVFAAVGRGEIRRSRSGSLGRLLEPIRKKYDLPALAGAVILEGRLAACGARGYRKYGGTVKVTPEDKFHIGSCTKAMTATLVGMLVERGKLGWEMRLGDALPGLAEQMHPGYRDVSLRHLLAHRAGLPPSSRSWPKGKTFMDMHNLPGSATEQRFAYARMMLAQEPQAEPGSKYVYSNAGYSILGLIAERAMKRPWEDLMREMVFEPLRMASAGFGAMGTPGMVDQPWQHRMAGDKLQPVGPGRYSDNPPVLAPGGTVHCSIRDWARFVAAHLKGPRGESDLLKAETFKILHTPEFGGNYAGGWQVTKRDWAGGKVLTHTGSNNMNFAVVWMAPKRNFAVLVASNQGKGEVAKACDEAAWAIIKEFLTSKK